MRLLIALLIVLFVSLSVPAHAYVPTAQHRERMVTCVNNFRMNHGLPALRWSDRLADASQQHVKEMALKQTIWHDVEPILPLFENVGQNTGMHTGFKAMCRAFKQSPAHRAVMLDRKFHRVGIEYSRDANGFIYLDMNFGGN